MMALNFIGTAYEDIEFQFNEPAVVDWNGDGFEDVVVLHVIGHYHALSEYELSLHEFHGGAVREVVGVFECRACPGEFSKVCYGRGKCFDDVTATAFAQDSTAILMATGNGSCSCNAVHFHGNDVENRITCVEGQCPAGTKEDDGRCSPCDAGSFSPTGGLSKICLPGRFSSNQSSICTICAPGTVAKTSGASACDTCPAGKYKLTTSFATSVQLNGCHPGAAAHAPAVKLDFMHEIQGAFLVTSAQQARTQGKPVQHAASVPRAPSQVQPAATAASAVLVVTRALRHARDVPPLLSKGAVRARAVPWAVYPARAELTANAAKACLYEPPPMP